MRKVREENAAAALILLTIYDTVTHTSFRSSRRDIRAVRGRLRAVISKYRVRTKYGPPYDTKYCLFLIVLWKNYEKKSHWLGLDNLSATSKQM